MTIAESVDGFLRHHARSAYCDDCLKDSLRLKRRQQAQRVTEPLGLTQEFVRENGLCAGCGADEKFVTRYAAG